jgi:hypothetical protein
MEMIVSYQNDIKGELLKKEILFNYFTIKKV